jgi:hypothetical protein
MGLRHAVKTPELAFPNFPPASVIDCGTPRMMIRLWLLPLLAAIPEREKIGLKFTSG